MLYNDRDTTVISDTTATIDEELSVNISEFVTRAASLEVVNVRLHVKNNEGTVASSPVGNVRIHTSTDGIVSYRRTIIVQCDEATVNHAVNETTYRDVEEEFEDPRVGTTLEPPEQDLLRSTRVRVNVERQP